MGMHACGTGKAVQAVKLHASDLMLSIVSGQGAAEDGLPDLRPLLRLRQLYPHSRKLRRLWCRASQGCTMSPSAVRAMGQHCIAVHALLMVLSLRSLFASRSPHGSPDLDWPGEHETDLQMLPPLSPLSIGVGCRCGCQCVVALRIRRRAHSWQVVGCISRGGGRHESMRLPVDCPLAQCLRFSTRCNR